MVSKAAQKKARARRTKRDTEAIDLGFDGCAHDLYEVVAMASLSAEERQAVEALLRHLKVYWEKASEVSEEYILPKPRLPDCSPDGSEDPPFAIINFHYQYKTTGLQWLSAAVMMEPLKPKPKNKPSKKPSPTFMVLPLVNPDELQAGAQQLGIVKFSSYQHVQVRVRQQPWSTGGWGSTQRSPDAG